MSSVASKAEFPLAAHSPAGVALAGTPLGVDDSGGGVSTSAGCVEVASAVAAGAGVVRVRVGVRWGVRVRVGVRVEGMSEATDRVVVADGLGLDDWLAVGEGVSVGIARIVAVCEGDEPAVGLGCAVSDDLGWKGVPVGGLGITVTLGSAGAAASPIGLPPPSEPSASRRRHSEATARAGAWREPPASL